MAFVASKAGRNQQELPIFDSLQWVLSALAQSRIRLYPDYDKRFSGHINGGPTRMPNRTDQLKRHFTN
jgi:hypothetical protein